MTIATHSIRLRHHVRLVHASTGAPIGPVAVRLSGAGDGWAARPVPGGAVVTARAGAADPPTPPSLAITVTDGVQARLLVFPPWPGLPPHTVVVDLTEAEIERRLHPVPMVLTVVLVMPSTQAPRTGRKVAVRATGGPAPRPTIPLPETLPGVYTSAPAEWTAAFTPADLLVDGHPLRSISMDTRSASTRIRLVDTA